MFIIMGLSPVEFSALFCTQSTEIYDGNCKSVTGRFFPKVFESIFVSLKQTLKIFSHFWVL